MTATLEVTCVVADCDRPRARGKGWASKACGTHRSRKIRTGSYSEDVPIIPNGEWHHDHPSYETAHKRVTSRRGKASAHTCACGEQAAEWSYDGGSANELTDDRSMFGERTVRVRYSGDPADYTARCLSCHRKHDYERIG